jgi:hypothetical protein
VRLCGRHSREQLPIDQQPPDLLERDRSYQFLDVYSAIAERTALAVRLGDFRGERDYAFET